MPVDWFVRVLLVVEVNVDMTAQGILADLVCFVFVGNVDVDIVAVASLVDIVGSSLAVASQRSAEAE